MQCARSTVHCNSRSVKFEIFSVECIVYILQCAVCSTQCALCSVYCIKSRVCSISFHSLSLKPGKLDPNILIESQQQKWGHISQILSEIKGEEFASRLLYFEWLLKEQKGGVRFPTRSGGLYFHRLMR